MALRQLINNNNSTSIIQKQLTQKKIGEIPPQSVTIKYKLSSGSSSTIFLGSYQNEQVVIKQFKPFLMHGTTKDVMRKEWEMLCASFPSRYIVRPVGYSIKPPQIVMEYVKNGALDEYMRTHALTAQQKLSIAHDVALGILRLLKVGIVHRDIKTANVLLTEDLRAKICDFDLARRLDSKEKIPASGTVGYLAIEYYNNLNAISLPAADVFSFGIVLLELFVSQEDFDEYTDICAQLKLPIPTLVSNITKKIDSLICHYSHDWPESFKSIVVDCLNVNPEQRPSMHDIQKRLSQLLGLDRYDEEEKPDTSLDSLSLFSCASKNPEISPLQTTQMDTPAKVKNKGIGCVVL